MIINWAVAFIWHIYHTVANNIALISEAVNLLYVQEPEDESVYMMFLFKWLSKHTHKVGQHL